MVGRPPFTMRSIPAFFSVLHLTDMVQCSRIVPPSGGRSAHVVRRRLSPCRGLRLPARMKVKPMKTSDLIEQRAAIVARMNAAHTADRSEEHTSELQSLMRTSYAVFCLKKK